MRRLGSRKKAADDFAVAMKNAPDDRLRALNLSIMAIANHNLNQHAGADMSLSEAAKLINGLNAVPEHQGHHDLPIAKILLREAAAKTGGASNP